MPNCYSSDIVELAKERLKKNESNPRQDSMIISGLVKELEHTRRTVLAQVNDLRVKVHRIIGEPNEEHCSNRLHQQ